MRLTCGLLVLFASIAPAADDAPAFAPGAKIEGKTLAEWSAVWWQWALPIKKDQNPCTDKTGAFAHVGQKGPVFFLAGAGGGTVERTCKVPAGKPILFPLVTDVENAPADKADEKALRAEAKKVMDRAADLEVTLDGKPVAVGPANRVASAAFPFSGPDRKEDGLFDNIAGKQLGVSDGYWLALKPLPVGAHTLRFKARLKSDKKEEQFDLDMTYKLTVVEGKP